MLALVLTLVWSAGAVHARPGPDLEAEITALERALAKDADDPEVREALALAYFESGDALLAARTRHPGAEPEASWAAELARDAEAYRQQRWPEAAEQALRAAIELDPNEKSLYTALASVWEEPAPAPETGSESFVPAPHEVDWRETITPLLVPAALAAAVVFVLFLVMRPLLRGKGDLAVVLDYPESRRGVFTVKVLKRRPKAWARRREHAMEVEKARASTRFEHNLVSRETQFRSLPARSYWVLAEGLLQGEGDQRRPVSDEREVSVERGRIVRVEFDFRPSECPIEVQIVQGGQRVPRARIAVAGDLQSMRYAGDGTAHMRLPIGEHRLRIGGEDRVAERLVKVENLEPISVSIDLEEAADLVFQHCPGAVEPYLQGDLTVASTALERAGQTDLSHVMRARFHQARGELEKAAQQYEAAGHLLDAADHFAECGAFERAAVLFERGGDASRAAEMFNAAGDLLRAGRAYEDAGEHESAALCYREGGAHHKLIDVLEKLGQHYEAGTLSLDRNETTRAIRNLQQVGPGHAHYNEACRTLATTFSDQGKLELAVQKADEAITFSGPAEASPDTFVWYGSLLERAGKTQRALSTFEDLLERVPDHEEARDRADQLRKRLSAERRRGGQADGENRYEILKELGRGGMGVVYKAKDTRLGRIVAVKRLPENMKDHPKAVDLFLREARAAAAMNHPNIVTLHDIDQDDQGFFLTMELLVGTNLAEIVKKRGRIAPRDGARIAVQVCEGLEYAHNKGLVHRDIKTANLFFTKERVVKIMDFGLARMLQEVSKGSTTIGGTPYYMAPEQGTGGGVDHRADLYAFGVTLFEILTGTLPFAEGDVTYQHRHTEAPDPRSRFDELPDPLAELVLELMAKDPDDRPPDATAVATALREALSSLD